jgi:hypothetical protein
MWYYLDNIRGAIGQEKVLDRKPLLNQNAPLGKDRYIQPFYYIQREV